MDTPSPPERLCRLEDIPDGEALGFALREGAEETLVFVVRQGGRVHGYRNRCPHVGTPLDMVPDRFMTHDRRHILCMTHGARFRVSDGYCFTGPCQGQSLDKVAVAVRDDAVFLEQWPGAAGGR